MTVRHDPDLRRFETDHDDPAYLEYDTDENGSIEILHTIVPPHLEGKGIGSALAKRALEYAKDEGKTVVPSCSFVRSWIERHPEYQDLVAE